MGQEGREREEQGGSGGRWKQLGGWEQTEVEGLPQGGLLYLVVVVVGEVRL